MKPEPSSKPQTISAAPTRRLGNSDFNLTPIGFGAWAIGGSGWSFAWGEQDDNESVSAIQRAIDLGMNWIDTAAVYGTGHSEEVVARALAGRGDSAAGAKRPFVFTKCGLTWNEKREVSRNLNPDSIRKECEDSLRRLQVNVIDLYQMHWPDPDREIEAAWTAMAKLQQQGKVRFIGVSNFSVAQMERVRSIAPITSLQPPYSMLRPGVGDEILPYCLKNNIGVIVYSPMLSGLLTGAMTKERAKSFGADDWRSKNKEFQEPRLSKNLELVEELRKIGDQHGRNPGEVAIAWTLHNPAVTAAIVGGRSADQVEGISGAMTFRLTDEEYKVINGHVERLK